MKRRAALILFSPLALLCTAAAPGPAKYTPGGAMLPPAGYRDWIYLSSGLDMNYRDGAQIDGASMFGNVFVNPTAWKAFKATGHWPNGTVMVLENRGASSKGSINKHGQYQTGEVMGLEVHVRDDARFKGGWGFFGFEGEGPAKLIGYEANCYECHQRHGAVDTTFVQFYPTAKPIAVTAATFSEKQ